MPYPSILFSEEALAQRERWAEALLRRRGERRISAQELRAAADDRLERLRLGKYAGKPDRLREPRFQRGVLAHVLRESRRTLRHQVSLPMPEALCDPRSEAEQGEESRAERLTRWRVELEELLQVLDPPPSARALSVLRLRMEPRPVPWERMAGDFRVSVGTVRRQFLKLLRRLRRARGDRDAAESVPPP